jgi:signal transduction histidine kinase
VMTSVLAVRRRAPLTVAFVVMAALLLQTWADVPTDAQLATVAAPLVAVFSVGAYTRGRASYAGLAGCALMAVAVIRTDGGGLQSLVFAVAVVVGAPWLAGRLVRLRTEQARSADELARAAIHSAEEQARRAAEAERRRIARELHDVISHALSVMVVQAGAAERLVRDEPDRAIESLRHVQGSGRQAVAEMRRLLTLLRTPDEPDRDPQPELFQLEQLVDESRHEGRNVSLHVRGQQRPLPRGLDLSAYRVVQEALTNVRKHANGAAARVVVEFGPDRLELTVEDDGAATQRPVGQGQGLLGMRERVSLYGGTLDMGPGGHGGWRVHATFPLEPAP